MFGVLQHFSGQQVAIILFFSLVGIGGSYGVAWFGMRINTFANSRTAFASLRGFAFPVYAIPLQAGMSVGMLLISVELLIMLCILLYIPGDYAGACFIGFAIGESLGASALRIAGGIFTKIADIGSDLMKIVFNVKEDDPRNPGVIADCTGDNAGDSVGPTADGFETYGVTGVALISFILLAVVQGQGKADMANGYELDIIAAAVVGGASLSGGRASVVGAVEHAPRPMNKQPAIGSNHKMAEKSHRGMKKLGLLDGLGLPDVGPARVVVHVTDVDRSRVARWLREVANARVHGTTQQIPTECLIDERTALLPLPRRLPMPGGMMAIGLAVPTPTESIQHPLAVYRQLLEVA
jgi:hypothetical protein